MLRMILVLIVVSACIVGTAQDSCPTFNSKVGGKPKGAYQAYYDPGDVVEVGCDGGYNRIGTPMAKCQPDGSWLRSLEVACAAFCYQRNTGGPDIVIHNGWIKGFKKDQYYKVGDTVDIQCYGGFLNAYNAVVTCKENKSWDVPKYACIPTCSTSSLPSSPAYSWPWTPQNNILPGNAVKLRCKDSYDAVGDTDAVCDKDGNWKLNKDMCKRYCSLQHNSVRVNNRINNGKIVGVDPPKYYYYAEETVNIQCDPGFTKSDDAFVTCKDDGTWKIPDNACRPIRMCKASDLKVSHASVWQSGRHYNTSNADTSKGSSPSGKTGNTGNGNGKTDNTAHGNGKTSKDNYLPGDIVKLVCQPGYPHLDDAVAVCDESGKWHFNQDMCKQSSKQDSRTGGNTDNASTIVLLFFLCLGWLAFISILTHYIVFGKLCDSNKNGTKDTRKELQAPSQVEAPTAKLVDNDLYGQHDRVMRFENRQGGVKKQLPSAPMGEKPTAKVVDNDLYGQHDRVARFENRQGSRDQPDEPLYANMEK